MKLEQDLNHILDHTKDIWMRFAGCNLFLTGGTGFFGKWILETFLFANRTLEIESNIIVLSRDPERFLSQNVQFSHPSIKFLKGDIRDFVFPVEPIDYIIHAAVEINAELLKAQPLLMYETIVDGAKRVFELGLIKEVKALLNISSGSVYGKQPHDLTNIPEAYAGAPDIFDKAASLGEGKRVTEMLGNICYRNYGLNVKTARCFAFVGPYGHLDAHFAMGNFIKHVLNGEDIVINGDGSPHRSYLYASDTIIWLLRILIYGEPCRPYNVGSDIAITIEQLAHMVASFSHRPLNINVATPKTSGPAIRYVPDISRAQNELDLHVWVDLKEAINKTIAFYQ